MSLSSVVTLANSIIGVSILAMPFCFKQCGVILATIMLLLSGMLVKVCCHLLLKSALLARRRNFEHLAFHTFGTSGKLLVELGIIGYLAGTAIAFFVVMGDLGPPMMAKMGGIEYTANFRMIILTGLGLFVALPLSLLRNIESLQVICTASIGFYLCVVLRVALQAVPHIVTAEWMSVVNLWRPAGMLQCFPIFSLALSCQTNIFEVYASLPDATPSKMNDVVKGAVNLCTALYITIGFFGYIAFCYVDIAGNVLSAFPGSSMVDVIKLGFCISVALSFPLVLFPCRTSVHSLIFRKTYQGIGSTELVNDYIPPTRFNMITTCIIIVCLIIGILVPDIELVLGLVGSTMGSCVCVIFPALMFLRLTTKEGKDTTERLSAKFVLCVGVSTLLLGTYVNLGQVAAPEADVVSDGHGPQTIGSEFVPPLPDNKPVVDDHVAVAEKIDTGADKVIKNISRGEKPDLNVDKPKVDEPLDEIKRQEPPVPQEPIDSVAEEKEAVDSIDNIIKEVESVFENIDSAAAAKDPIEDELKGLVPEVPVERKKKESTENSVKENQGVQADKLIEELAKQKEESAKIIEQQKEILNELKEHQKKDKQAEEIAAIVDSVKQAADSQNPGNILVVQGKGPNLVQPEQSQKVNIQQPVANPESKPNQPLGDHEPIESGNQPSHGVLTKQVELHPNAGKGDPEKQIIVSKGDPSQLKQPENQVGDKVGNRVAIQPNQAGVQPNQAGVQPNQAVLQQNQAGVQPNQAVLQQNQAGVQPNQAVLQQNQAGVQPNQAVLQQNQAGVQPNQAGLQPNQAALQQNQAGVQPNQAALQQNQAGLQPNQAALQQNQAGVQYNQAVLQQNQAGIKPIPHNLPLGEESNVKQPVEKPLDERHLADPVVRKESAGLGGEVEADDEKVGAQVAKLGAEGEKVDDLGDNEAVRSGRDLKDIRSKRDVDRDVFKAVLDKVVNGKRVVVPEVVVAPNCLNDPFCEEKFHRDPASDSMVDRDFVKYLQVGQQGGRNLLNKDETMLSNLTVDRSNRSL